MPYQKTTDGAGQYTPVLDAEEHSVDSPKTSSDSSASISTTERIKAAASPRHQPRRWPRSRRWADTFTIVAYVEAANLVLLAGIFLAIYYPRSHDSAPAPPGAISSLSDTSVTKTLVMDKTALTLVDATPAADEFWTGITRGHNNGLVSVPRSWAEGQGLAASGLATGEGETVLQVDAFHQLHCLQRIRHDIIAAPYLVRLNPHPSKKEPYFAHTLHCIDYLRQALVCHADTTLVSTGADLEFDRSPPRQCRDFDAIAAWVMENRWNVTKYFGPGWD